MTQESGHRSLETVRRAFTILETLEELDGARVTDVANHLELAPSTVHGYLSTLERNRYLVKEGDEYNLGMRLLNVGIHASVRREEYSLAEQKVTDLAETTNERAQYIVEEHGLAHYVLTETRDTAVQIDARVGKESYLHASAAGKSILAHLPEERIEAILDRWGLPELTENTITDRGELFDELADVRDRGYSFNKNESIKGLRAVGVPVRETEDRVIGALSVSVPSNRMREARFDEEIPNLLLEAANEIELQINY